MPMVVIVMVVTRTLLLGGAMIMMILCRDIAVPDFHGDVGSEGVHGADGQNQQGVEKVTHEENQRRIRQAMMPPHGVKGIVERSKCRHFVDSSDVRGGLAKKKDP